MISGVLLARSVAAKLLGVLLHQPCLAGWFASGSGKSFENVGKSWENHGKYGKIMRKCGKKTCENMEIMEHPPYMEVYSLENHRTITIFQQTMFDCRQLGPQRFPTWWISPWNNMWTMTCRKCKYSFQSECDFAVWNGHTPFSIMFRFMSIPVLVGEVPAHYCWLYSSLHCAKNMEQNLNTPKWLVKYR